MKNLIFFASLFLASNLFAQFGNDDLYLRLSGAYSFGFNPTQFTIGTTNVDISAGKHYGGELAIGKRLTKGVYGEFAFAYLSTPSGNTSISTTSSQIEPGFTRFGTVLTFKYCAELSSNFALSPSLGLGVFMGGKIEEGGFNIQYDPAFGLQPGIEGQYKFADRFITSFGFRFRLESYNAYDSSVSSVANLPRNAANLNADGVQLHLGVTYILIRKNLLGRKI